MTKKISKPNKIQQDLINTSHKYEKILKKIIKHFKADISSDMKINERYDLVTHAWNIAFIKRNYPEVSPRKIIKETKFLKSQRKLLKKMLKYILKKWPVKMLFIRSLDIADVEPKPHIHVNVIEDDHFLDNILNVQFDRSLNEEFEQEIEEEPEEESFFWDFKEGFVNRAAIKLIPLKPFKKWANIDCDAEPGNKNYNTYLIPNINYDQWLEDNYQKLFEQELLYIDPSSRWWPTNRTYKKFKKWFSIEISTLIYDFFEEPLNRGF